MKTQNALRNLKNMEYSRSLSPDPVSPTTTIILLSLTASKNSSLYANIGSLFLPMMIFSCAVREGDVSVSPCLSSSVSYNASSSFFLVPKKEKE